MDLKGVDETHSVMPARPPMGRDKGGIQALDRAFLILDIIADAGGEAKLTEISTIAGLNVSTCHHLISTLYNWGYVARGAGSKTYVLGSRILHLSAACLRQVDLPRRAQSYVERLNDQTREAVPNELDRIVADKGLTAFTPNTIVSLDKLKEELRLTRRNGFAIDREEFQPGVICIGAAIRDHAGAVVGSISVSSPLFRATAEYLDQIKVHLIAATDELSMELGAPGAMLRGSSKKAAAE